MGSQLALSVNDVHVRYGDAEVLRGVNIQVNFGETITVIGANGAGKTTLLKTISGYSNRFKELSYLGVRS